MQQINRLWELKKANRKNKQTKPHKKPKNKTNPNKPLLPVTECWFTWDNNFTSPSLGGSDWNKHLICKQDSVLKENEDFFWDLDMCLFIFHASVLSERLVAHWLILKENKIDK